MIQHHHLGLEGLDGLGGKPQADHAIALRPENALPLEVDLLDLVVANVGEGDRHSVVGTLAQQHAFAAARLLLGLNRASSGARHLKQNKI